MLSLRQNVSLRELRGDEKKLHVRVRQTLWAYDPLRASHAQILIEVMGRNVRLAGRVRTLPQKIVAEVLLKRLEGLDMVSNELIADPEVVRSVADALATDPRTAPHVIEVDSSHGVVTLRGDVPDEATREAALHIASESPLAAAVHDRLSVNGVGFDLYSIARRSDPAAVLSGDIQALAQAGPSGMPVPV